MKAKTKLEKNVKKLFQMIMENKTPLERQNEYNSQLRMLDERYRLKFFQLKQDYLLQRKLIFEKFNSQ